MNNSGSGLGGNHFTALRFLPLLVITAACLIVREQYPLSNFPMYSSFARATFYLYLADANGQPIACEPAVGMSTATLKKIFVTEMRKERDRLGQRKGNLPAESAKAVGERILAMLKNTHPAPDGLRLYQVDIALRDHQFSKETTLVAEVR